MLKITAILAGTALALTLTAAQAHDSRGNSYGNSHSTQSNGGLLGLTANVGGLLGVQANVGSSSSSHDSGLLNVQANVGGSSRNSSQLLNVDANVGGRNNLATARVDVGGNNNSRGCDFCGDDGGVGHNSGW